MKHKLCFKIFYIFLIIVLCNVFPSKGQLLIEGLISDSSGDPIPFTQIILKTLPEEKTIDYTQADAKGKYKMIITKSGEYQLAVHSMSFHPASFIIPYGNDSIPEKIEKNVMLHPMALEINEVVVITDIPIREKKDTIVFNAASFLKGNEEVAEDLLKILPGINVDENGIIRIRGKEIEKIMIEGDDLFEKGYAVISKNLHVGAIDKVELLLKFSNKPILKDFENSDKVALNLILKDDAKVRLYGYLGIGMSTSNHHTANANLMSFKKKRKLYFFSNSNDLGYDVLGAVEDIINPAFTKGDYIPLSVTEPSHFIELKASRPNLSNTRIKFNDDRMLSLNSIISASDKLKFKAISLLTSETENYFRDSELRYLAGEESFSTTEQYQLRDKLKNAYLKLEGNLETDRSSEIDYKGTISVNEGLAKSRLLFNKEVSGEKLEKGFKTTDQIVAFIKRLNEGRAFIITGRFLMDNRMELFSVNDLRDPDVFQESGYISDLRQQNNAAFLFTGTEITYLIRSGENTIIHINTGLKYNHNRIKTNLELLDSSGIKSQAGHLFTNNLDFHSSDLNTGIKLDRVMGKVLFSGSLSFHQLSHKISDNGNDTRDNGSNFFISPKLSGKWEIKQNQRLQGTYVYNAGLTSLSDLMKGKMLTGYNTFRQGSGEYDIMRGHLIFLVFNHGSWMSKKHFYSSFLYYKNSDYMMPHSQITPEFIFLGSRPGKGKQTIAFSTSTDIFIRPLLNNLKINLNITDLRYETVINQLPYPVNWLVLSSGPELKSVFRSILNYHIGSRFTLNQIESGSKIRSFDNFQFIDFIFKVSKSLNIITRVERYQFSQMAQKKNTWHFVDAHLNWNLRPNKWKVSLDINNIMNIKNFGSYNITELGMSSVNYRLVPGYVLLRIGYRI